MDTLYCHKDNNFLEKTIISTNPVVKCLHVWFFYVKKFLRI